MEGLIIAWIMAYALVKIVSEGATDWTLARKGIVSPRLQGKYGGDAAARRATSGYGLGQYLRESWNDYWPRRAAALKAARDARDAARARGEKISIRDRWRAAVDTLEGRWRNRQGNQGVGEPNPSTTTRPAPLAGDVTGGDKPRPSTDPGDPSEGPTTPATTTDGKSDSDTTPDPQTTPAGDKSTGDTDTTTKEDHMTTPTTTAGPTGEVLNYETALTEIDSQISATQERIDKATAALSDVERMKASVDEIQLNYKQSAQAAASKLDQQQALNLDGTTLGHASTTVEALPPSAVDSMLEQIEVVEQEIRHRLEQDEQALGSLQAEREHLQTTYADAHETVQGRLGGDSRFLGN